MVRVPQVRDLREKWPRNPGKGMKIDIVNSGLVGLVRSREMNRELKGRDRQKITLLIRHII